jgi:hypothetical protein
MTLNNQGYVLLDLPSIDESTKASFDELGLDTYVPVKNRYRRFAQYRMDYTDGTWQFKRLPDRPYITYPKFNPVAGGIRREYKSIVTDFTEVIRLATEAIPLDTATTWQINVHQIRIFVKKGEIEGVVVPEGPHKDGHEFVFIAVYDRHNITGAEMTLRPDDDKDMPFLTTTLDAGKAVVIDDMNLWHYVSDIDPVDQNQVAYRDTLIVSYSRWTERWYGEKFESEALTETVGA